MTLENDDNDECGTFPCSMLGSLLWLKMSSKLWVPISTSLSRSKRETTTMIFNIITYVFHGMATQLISLTSYNTKSYSGVKILAESDRIGVRSLHYRSQQPCCLFVMNTRTGYIITQLEGKWFFPPHMTPTRELKKEGTFGSFNWLPAGNCFCDNNLACVKKKQGETP